MEKMNDLLQGKAVIVTGSGRGIGAHCAAMLASVGASVVVNDIDADAAEDTARAIAAKGGRAIAHRADVSRWDEAEELVERCVREFDAIDGLVNNAGVLLLARVDELEEKAVRRLVDANLHGVIAVSVFASRKMVAAGRGAIVNITSGAIMGSARLSVYGASKAAIAAFTYSCAIDLEGTGVRVNAVSPRGHTRMVDQLQHFIAATTDRQTIERRADPGSCAPAVAYLLSDRAKDFNGQVFYIDDHDFTIMNPPSLSLPLLRQEKWSLDLVTQAFENELASRKPPLGICGLDSTAAQFQLLRRGEAANK